MVTIGRQIRYMVESCSIVRQNIGGYLGEGTTLKINPLKFTVTGLATVLSTNNRNVNGSQVYQTVKLIRLFKLYN